MSNKKNIQQEKLKVLRRCWRWFSVSYWGIMRKMKDFSLWESEIVISPALWDILCLGMKQGLIKSEAEILPLASRTLFFFILSKERNVPVNPWTSRVHHCLTALTIHHLCISVYVCISAGFFWKQGWRRRNVSYL